LKGAIAVKKKTATRLGKGKIPCYLEDRRIGRDAVTKGEVGMEADECTQEWHNTVTAPSREEGK